MSKVKRVRLTGNGFRGSRSSLCGLAKTMALATLFIPLTGCHKAVGTEAFVLTPNRTTNPAATARSSNSKFVGKSTIPSSPAYRVAVAAYARKEYRSARKQLLDLRGGASITPSDKIFLDRQIALCEQAVTGKPLLQPAMSGGKPFRKARQSQNADCGPRALLLVAQEIQPARSLPTLASLRTVAGTTPSGTSMEGLVKAAERVGLKAEGVQMDKDALSHLSTPALAFVDGNHFIAVLAVHDRRNSLVGGEDTATIHDPNQPGKEDVSLTRLLARSGGLLLKLTPLSQDKQTAVALSKDEKSKRYLKD